VSSSPSDPPEEPGTATGLTVVGIGADGWDGLAGGSRRSLLEAQVVFGSGRQLELLPPDVQARQVYWPAPLLDALPDLLAEHAGARRAVLASGDPTFFGIASTIRRMMPGLELTVLPHPSSASLACARLGWAQQDVEVVSLVGRPVESLHPVVQPGARVLVLAAGARSPGEVAALLRTRGFGGSRMTALSNLGAKDESRVAVRADAWPEPEQGWPGGGSGEALTVVALECVAGPEAGRRSRTPGMPDDAYENDGQLTKRHVRAVTLSSLAPAPGELLWDVGGGAGSIGIEWMRTHPACRAVSIERDAERADRITRNAAALGVPGLDVVLGSAPAALAGLPRPDAVFVGGGASSLELLETCWLALPPGGRIVVNVTTLESEQAVFAARSAYGGELTRIEITRAAPVGRFTGWRPAMPVTQWVAVRGADEPAGPEAAAVAPERRRDPLGRRAGAGEAGFDDLLEGRRP
jgi:precorrin-6Y C5,15-methyltransferase (decarboxylating)